MALTKKSGKWNTKTRLIDVTPESARGRSEDFFKAFGEVVRIKETQVCRDIFNGSLSACEQ